LGDENVRIKGTNLSNGIYALLATRLDSIGFPPELNSRSERLLQGDEFVRSNAWIWPIVADP
jgi:hypothetical protein